MDSWILPKEEYWKLYVGKPPTTWRCRRSKDYCKVSDLFCKDSNFTAVYPGRMLTFATRLCYAITPLFTNFTRPKNSEGSFYLWVKLPSAHLPHTVEISLCSFNCRESSREDAIFYSLSWLTWIEIEPEAYVFSSRRFIYWTTYRASFSQVW